MILKSHGFGNLDLKVPGGHETGQTAEHTKMHLEIVRDLLLGIGFRSIYILLDKVDETDFAGNDAQGSFLIIKPLIRDLELLQTRGIGFKFFLWDKLKPYYIKLGRPDRITHFTLSWSTEELNNMLSKRLIAFSEARVRDLSKLTNASLAQPLQFLVVTFAAGSPRDMIRICQRILSEQMKANSNSRTIDLEAIDSGILEFSKERSTELAGEDMLRDLLKIGEVDFTTNQLASSVLKVSVNAARSKIEGWMRKGLVERIGEQRCGNGRPVHHYAVTVVRLARAMLSQMDITDFLRQKVLSCDSCEKILIRDWEQPGVAYNCPACGKRQALNGGSP